MFNRVDDGIRDVAETRYRTFLEERCSQPVILNDVDAGPWLPALNALCLAGEQVVSVHLNDPVNDGVPSVAEESPGLDAVIEVCRESGMYMVLKPEKPQFEDAVFFLQDTVKALQTSV